VLLSIQRHDSRHIIITSNKSDHLGCVWLGGKERNRMERIPKKLNSDVWLDNSNGKRLSNAKPIQPLDGINIPSNFGWNTPFHSTMPFICPNYPSFYISSSSVILPRINSTCQ
ncbi:hypothetical protein TorRG33x02_314700, partial [Trema orientale]